MGMAFSITNATYLPVQYIESELVNVSPAKFEDSYINERAERYRREDASKLCYNRFLGVLFIYLVSALIISI